MRSSQRRSQTMITCCVSRRCATCITGVDTRVINHFSHFSQLHLSPRYAVGYLWNQQRNIIALNTGHNSFTHFAVSFLLSD